MQLGSSPAALRLGESWQSHDAVTLPIPADCDYAELVRKTGRPLVMKAGVLLVGRGRLLHVPFDLEAWEVHPGGWWDDTDVTYFRQQHCKTDMLGNQSMILRHFENSCFWTLLKEEFQHQDRRSRRQE